MLTHYCSLALSHRCAVPILANGQILFVFQTNGFRILRPSLPTQLPFAVPMNSFEMEGKIKISSKLVYVYIFHTLVVSGSFTSPVVFVYTGHSQTCFLISYFRARKQQYEPCYLPCDMFLSLFLLPLDTASSNENIFRVTGPLWWEFTGYRWISLTKASDSEFLCLLWCAPEQTVG